MHETVPLGLFSSTSFRFSRRGRIEEESLKKIVPSGATSRSLVKRRGGSTAPLGTKYSAGRRCCGDHRSTRKIPNVQSATYRNRPAPTRRMPRGRPHTSSAASEPAAACSTHHLYKGCSPRGRPALYLSSAAGPAAVAAGAKYTGSHSCSGVLKSHFRTAPLRHHMRRTIA